MWKLGVHIGLFFGLCKIRLKQWVIKSFYDHTFFYTKKTLFSKDNLLELLHYYSYLMICVYSVVIIKNSHSYVS